MGEELASPPFAAIGPQLPELLLEQLGYRAKRLLGEAASGASSDRPVWDRRGAL